MLRTAESISRRSALAGIGAGGVGLALASWNLGVSAQEATPNAEEEEEADLLRETERERLSALVAADMEVADQLHADDFEHINPEGRTFTKEEFLGAVEAGGLDFVAIEPEGEIAVRLYDEGAAIRYQGTLEIVAGGEALPPRGHWFTLVYERRDGDWQAVWSHVTFAADEA